MFRKRYLMLSLALSVCCACTQTHFKKIPRTGFISHYRKSDHKRVPFDSYWDVSDNKDWNERVDGKKHKSQAIYLTPVTLAYFQNMPADAYQRQQINALRDYFDKRLNEKLTELSAEDSHFHLVSRPTADAYRVEIAILSATPGSAWRNLINDASGYVVTGGGFLTDALADRGSISMGARYYAPNGKLVAEVADFEYGEPSLVGLAFVDLKDFMHYAYQRQSIDQWVNEFAKLFTTRHEQKISKPWFTLKPY